MAGAGSERRGENKGRVPRKDRWNKKHQEHWRRKIGKLHLKPYFCAYKKKKKYYTKKRGSREGDQKEKSMQIKDGKREKERKQKHVC